MNSAPASTRATPRVLSVIAPMTQLNTPYPSTAYLTGFLRSQGFPAEQADLALELVLALFSQQGLQALVREAQAKSGGHSPESLSSVLAGFLAQSERYLATIAPTLAFLQGRDSTLAHRIVGRHFLPEGPRFASLDVYLAEEGEDPRWEPCI